ncbi:MAG: hypothetical protein WC979_07680 [Candidatus Pacearchaeota archaeon]|jgi:hypothetical protein
MDPDPQSNLDSTQPYIPTLKYTALSLQDSKKLFEHYRGCGKRTRKHPETINQMKFGSREVLHCLNPFILSFLQSPKEKRKSGGISFSTPPLDRIGYRLGGFEDLANTFKQNPEQLRLSTIDFALALRTVEGPNQVIAEDLADQVSVRYGSFKLPLLISLRGTILKQLPGSNYDSLGFKITEHTQIKHAPILNQPGYFSLDDFDEQTCLPRRTRKDKQKGDLELITHNTGLTKVYINIYRDIDAGHPDLGITDYSSRLFVVKK